MSTQTTPQQRAMLFGFYTRKHIQTLGTITGTAGSHLEFEVPKVRLLQAINLVVDVTLKNPAGGQMYYSLADDVLNQKMDLYDVLKRVNINFNNGFQNITASGKEFAVMNMLRVDSGVMIPNEEEGSMCHVYAGDFGHDTDSFSYRFKLEIPITLNDRDPAGLVLAQNPTCLINTTIDVADVLQDNAGIETIKITPEIVTFSIPDREDAMPDLTVLKMVDSRKEGFNSGASNVVRIPTGQIYRKLIFKLEDENGNAINPEDINGNFEFKLNTADIPYMINPHSLRFISVSQTGGLLPKGYYALDFSCQGCLPNMAGSRDYIDTETLTQFELSFNSSKPGKITLISERISRLKASK